MNPHFVNHIQSDRRFPTVSEIAMFGMGCFWGAEKKFWQQPGVYATAVGYAARPDEEPDVSQVCTGTTNHAEVVLVAFDPKIVRYDDLLKSVLGESRPDAGDAPGQRRRHAVPLGHLSTPANSSERRR